MYARLADFPVLDEFSSRIPAAVWNVWRRTWQRQPNVAQRRFALAGLKPLEAILEERQWICVDPTLGDSPILAWQRFEDAGRIDLAAPVACTILQYHFGASRYRENILLAIGSELDRRLKTTGS